jgi:hypothetical protein
LLALNPLGSLERVIPFKCGFDRLTSGKAREAGWVPGEQQTKEGDMRIKCLFVVALVAAFTLGTAQTAFADNDATGSVGAVQTGNVGVTPSVGAGEAGATAVSAPTSVAGTGDNTASSSVGAVQVGGGNTSSNSVGSVQSSPVSSTPTASAGAGGNTVNAGVPITVGGGGSNTSSSSIGAAQVGGGNTASDSGGVAQVGSAAAGAAFGVSLMGEAVSASFPVGVAGSGNDASDSIGAAQVGGGNTATRSFLVAQSGPVTAGPSVTTGGTPVPGGTTLTAAGAPSDGGTTAPGERTTAEIPNDEPAAPLGGNKLNVPVVGQLPFTGLGLLLFVILGLAFCAAGLGMRGRARACA